MRARRLLSRRSISSPRFEHAERRPASAIFNVTVATIENVSLPAIETQPISRMTWPVAIPARAVLTTSLALKPGSWNQQGSGILFRIGIADGRTYEELLTRHVDPLHHVEDRQWIPVTINLARYGGFKWSLFYQPSRRMWQIVFNTSFDPSYIDESRAGLPVWGAPAISASRP